MEGLEIPSVNVDEKELAQFRDMASVVTDQAKQVARTVHDKNTYDGAGEWCAAHLHIADTIRSGWMGKIRDMFHKKHAQMCDMINELAKPHEEAVKLVKARMGEWALEDEKRRREEDAKRIQEAREKHETECLSAAAQLEAQGNPVMAEAVLSSAENFYVAPGDEGPKGLRKRWTVQVDKLALIKAVAGGAVPLNAVQPDEKWLTKQATLMDGNLNYPGVVCREVPVVSIRKAS